MNRLKEARFKRNITQIRLWQKCGIQPFRISFIENGYVKARPAEKEKIADALGFPMDWLFPERKKKKNV